MFIGVFMVSFILGFESEAEETTFSHKIMNRYRKRYFGK